MRVAVTGSHGLIGTELVRVLNADGHDVTRLVRGPPGAGELSWDPREAKIDAAGLEGHDAVVNLAGTGLGEHRWSERYKAEIRASRVVGTLLLAETLASLDHPPRVLASASAVGYYGDRGEEELTETSGPGDGFLSEVVQEWEEATAAAARGGIRVATFRSGIVLTPNGGALKQMLTPFRLGLGGKFGSGRQYFSWVALDDEVAAIVTILRDESLRGPVNLAAPTPVTNAELTRTLGRVLRRPAVLPVPSLALDVLFGRQMVAEMLTGGQRVLPAVLQSNGFEFRHPELEAALRSMLDRPARAA